MRTKLRQSMSAGQRVVAARKEANRAAAKAAAVPAVGIFFLVGKTLHINSTPVAVAPSYGEAKVHDRGHFRWWQEMRAAHLVPDCEFEDFPRGRVVFQPKLQEFILMADRCILRRKDVVERIMEQMDLPPNTTVTTDSHYRCPGCMGADWTALLLELPDELK
jgi:hypothetical protein